MIHHGIKIRIVQSQGASIFVFGDLQYREDSPAFDEEFWEQFKSEFKSTPGAYAIGLGDYEDWLRPSVRARVQASMTGDDEARKQMDDRVRRGQDDILRRMDFLKGRLVGLHSGHHEWEFSSGDNSTQRLCVALKAPYLGWMASNRIGIGFGDVKANNNYSSYTIISMHGSGNAQFASTDARFLETRIVPAWIADHYVRGHSCKSAAWSPFERHFIRRRDAYGENASTVMCMNVGGFSRAYTDGHKSDYIERAGMLAQPTSYGIIRFKMRSGKEAAKQHGISSKGTKIIRAEQVIRFKDR